MAAMANHSIAVHVHIQSLAQAIQNFYSFYKNLMTSPPAEKLPTASHRKQTTPNRTARESLRSATSVWIAPGAVRGGP